MDILLKHLINKNIISENSKITKLSKGLSGAKIFGISGVKGDFILKNYDNDTEDIYKAGEKEYTFYSISNALNLKYLPTVRYTEKHEALGIIILLKKYREITIAEWDLPRQLMAADIIAQLHGKSEFLLIN